MCFARINRQRKRKMSSITPRRNVGKAPARLQGGGAEDWNNEAGRLGPDDLQNDDNGEGEDCVTPEGSTRSRNRRVQVQGPHQRATDCPFAMPATHQPMRATKSAARKLLLYTT